MSPTEARMLSASIVLRGGKAHPWPLCDVENFHEGAELPDVGGEWSIYITKEPADDEDPFPLAPALGGYWVSSASEVRALLRQSWR